VGSRIQAGDQSKVSEKSEDFQEDGLSQPPVEEEEGGDGLFPTNNGKSPQKGNSNLGINSKAEIPEANLGADPKIIEGNFPLWKNGKYRKRSLDFKGQVTTLEDEDSNEGKLLKATNRVSSGAGKGMGKGPAKGENVKVDQRAGF
jgi:hypothetical protein